MRLRDEWWLAVLLAAAVFFALAGAALTLEEAATPSYFDTAGKYIHRL